MKKNLALTAMVVAATSTAFAAEESEIETMLVIGEKEPGNMIVNAEDLEKIQAVTLEDIFANESSVAVGGGSVAAQKLYVRGFEDVMLNFTVDGAQNAGELYHHQSRIQLEPEFIKGVELDAGAGAATNGAGALTGALKVSLKEASDMLQPGQNFGALFKGTGEFNGEDGEKATVAAYGNLTDNTGLIAGYTYEDRGEYADGNGDIVEASPYEHARSFVKLNSSFNEHAWSLSFEDINDEATTYERPNLTNFGGTYQLSDQEVNRQTVAFNYGYQGSSELVDVKTTLYSNTSDFRVQRLNSPIIYGEGDFDSIGFDVRNTSIIGSQSFTYGIDYRADELQSAQNATPPPFWGESEQSASVMGLYVQDNWEVSDVLGITFGARYDDYQLQGDGGVSEGVDISDSGVSANVGINWAVTDNLELRTAYAQAFRGVTIREAFFSGLYIHDGNLESEEADNFEVGVSYDGDGYFVRGTVYKQNIENFIDTEFTGPPAWGYWRNVGDAKVEGYEAEVGFYTESLTGSLVVWEADNSLNGEPLVDSNMGLGTTIGRTWVAKLDYLTSDTLNMGMQVRYVEAVENDIDPTAPDKEAYTVAKLYLNWNPLDYLTLALAVNNAFDEFYYDQATYTYSFGTYVGYPAMGREISTSLTVRF